MVESIIGIRGKDFVLLAQDANTTKYGILNMKFDTNRLFKLSEHCAMLAGKIVVRFSAKTESLNIHCYSLGDSREHRMEICLIIQMSKNK